MTDPRQNIEPGTLVHSRYRVVSIVGTGGVATVYEAVDEQLGRTVALKVIPRGAAGSAELLRIEDEVRLIAGFSHPALVTLFDVVSDPATTATTLVMQFIAGEDLSARLARGALAPQAVAEIGAALAGALAYVHEAGVIHRDVKPANILLPSAVTQSALLADFGIARLIDSAGLTATGTIIGTASYLSPEQARGAELHTPTDIYSLGLVLLEALTGNRAFPGTAVESVAARLSADPEIPATLDAPWVQLLQRMLSRDPAQRPSATEVTAALASIDSPGATLVMPASEAPTERLAAAAATESLVPEAVMTEVARKPASRRKLVAIVVGLLAIIAVVAAVATATGLRNDASGSTPAPTPSTTASAAVTVEPISYPAVEGDLGEKLSALQGAVGAIDDASVANQLNEYALAVSQSAANGDYELARDQLDELIAAADSVQLSAAERDAISSTADDVRSELDALIRDADKPGKSDDRPGKNP